ncbi:MAG: HEPN domain-containing protein [Dehalococcoidia bacterium]|nr:HEPN domain-containing protein [Dehalococcoidia bacterium]
MPESDDRLAGLCMASVQASIDKLSELGVWPRPHAARNLRMGSDFSFQDIKDIPEVVAFMGALASNEHVRSIYFRDDDATDAYVLRNYWSQMLLRILSQTEGATVDAAVFREWYERLLAEVHTETAVWQSIDTVTGLVLRVEELKLDDSTVLKRTDAIHLFDLPGLAASPGWRPHGGDNAAVVTTVKMRKHDYAGMTDPGPERTKHIERCIAVIEALRLAKPGIPCTHCHATFQISDLPIDEPLAYCHEDANPVGHGETNVGPEDFDAIRGLWHERLKRRDNTLPPSVRTGPLDTAYGRFFRSYSGGDYWQNILDLTISLESMFSPSGNEELKHRISLRAAWLLDTEDRTGTGNADIYKLVKTMYDIRSNLVHGALHKKEKSDKKQKEKDEQIEHWIHDLAGTERGKPIGLMDERAAMESARAIVRKALAACNRLSNLSSDGPCFPFPPDFDRNLLVSKQRLMWQAAAGVLPKTSQ